MRVINKTIVTKDVEVITEDYNLCDKCDKEIDDSIGYNSHEFSLEVNEGTCFPSDNFGTRKNMELCKISLL